MGVRRKTYSYPRNGIIEVEEFHDGNYGAPGKRRKEKRKPSGEDRIQANLREKARRCRNRLLTYFSSGDIIATWTYRMDERPEDMAGALKDFQKAIRRVKKEYRGRGHELRWIRNIERGTKGGWHIHLIVNRIAETASILQEAWEHGGTWTDRIGRCDKFSPDFKRLASYLTKDEHYQETRKDGSKALPRIRESSYSTSRNMPLTQPKIDHLIRWKKEVHPKKGYSLLEIEEGINPMTGFSYRRYSMIRKEGEDEDGSVPGS